MGRGSLWGNEWWGTCKLPSMSTHVYDSWKNEKDKNLSNLAKSNSNISYIYMCVSIYISVCTLYTLWISVHSGHPYLPYLQKREMKEKLSWPPSLPLTLTCYFIHSPLSLSLYMKSPSQLPPQYQHQLQLETPHYFNTLTTTAQTIYMFNYIYDQMNFF